MLFELSQAKYRPLQLDAQDESGDTPLHLALKNEDGTEMAETLLRRGANPNLANKDGQISLHAQCANFHDPYMLRMIFEASYHKYHPPRDGGGRNGAEKEEGFYELAEMFFKISDKEGRAVRVNVPNKLGDRPLHNAARSGGRDRRELVRLLLRKDADPKLFSNDGLTPLHVACAAEEDDSSVVNMLLEIGDEIDVEDKFGRTPLRLAVKNLLPETGDFLLDNGPDLSNFVFSTDLVENLLPREQESWTSLKLRLAPRAMIVVEHLEKKGYKLDLSEALIVMSIFAKYEMFASKQDLALCRYDDGFRRTMKAIKINPSMSLDDLIQRRPKEAEEQFKYTNYSELNKSIDWQRFFEWFGEPCGKHLCEKLSRRFFLDWALECFMVLIGNRLPALCCDIIIDELRNEDLWNICLAAAGRSDEDSRIVSVIPRMNSFDLWGIWKSQRIIASMDGFIPPGFMEQLLNPVF
ncbi:hypothetical protein TKK_0005738 [Trichogramma kaykai]